MRIGVRLGPFWISSGSSRRRRRRRRTTTSARTWRGTGRATTPDERLVAFQCGHQHRSQSAAVECVEKRRGQIERGQSLHLVTPVLETPESREAARVRAEQKEARQRDRAARWAEAARLRAEQKETRQREWAAQKETRQATAAAQRRERAVRRAELAGQRAERKDAHQRELAGQRTDASRHRAERRQRVQQTRAERRMRRPPRGWPTWGLLSAGIAAVIAMALAIAAGNHPKSGLAAAGGSLMLLAIATGVVCVVGAVWRRVRHRRMQRPVSTLGSHLPVSGMDQFDG